MIWSSGTWRLAKKTCLGTHGGYDLCYSWIQNGQNGVVWGSDSPDCSWTPGCAGEYLRTWGSAACFELEGSWHGHTIWPIGEKLLGETTLPKRWEPFSQTKVICRPWKICWGATGWSHPRQDTAMRNPPPWQPRRHTPVAARKHCPDSSWTKQCTSQVSGQIGSPGGLSMRVLPRDYFTCRSIPFIVWFFVESGMENIQIKRFVWNMQFRILNIWLSKMGNQLTHCHSQ